MNWNSFWFREDGKQYDEQKRRKAAQKAAIYYLIALYVAYLGFSILKNRLAGDSTMSYPLAILFTSLLIIGAICVAWYAARWMKSEFKKSEISSSDSKEDQEQE